jgi:hypothetical protein
LNRRLEETSSLADSGFNRLADLSENLIDRIFWRALALIAAFFAALFAYRVATTWIVHRLAHGSRRGAPYTEPHTTTRPSSTNLE